MTDHYKIILDEAELDRFISLLPEEEPHEVYYLWLFARHKYSRLYFKTATIRIVLQRKETEKSVCLLKSDGIVYHHAESGKTFTHACNRIEAMQNQSIARTLPKLRQPIC